MFEKKFLNLMFIASLFFLANINTVAASRQNPPPTGATMAYCPTTNTWYYCSYYSGWSVDSKNCSPVDHQHPDKNYDHCLWVDNTQSGTIYGAACTYNAGVFGQTPNSLIQVCPSIRIS